MSDAGALRLQIPGSPTSALDPRVELQIIENVVRLAQQRGLTVLSVTHHPAWLRAATRVLALEAGRISEKASCCRRSLHSGYRSRG